MEKEIILVDDDKITNIINKKLIERYDPSFQVKVFDSPMFLVDYLKEKKKKEDPLLIFVDINMPGMNGWELLEVLSKKVKVENINVHILSSSIDPEDKKMADNFELVQSFISKPLTMGNLKEIRL